MIILEDKKSIKYTLTDIKESDESKGKITSQDVARILQMIGAEAEDAKGKCEDIVYNMGVSNIDLDQFGSMFLKDVYKILDSYLTEVSKITNSYISELGEISNQDKIRLSRRIEELDEESYDIEIMDVFKRLPVKYENYTVHISSLVKAIEILFSAFTTSSKLDVNTLDLGNICNKSGDHKLLDRNRYHVGSLKEKYVDTIMNLDIKCLEPLKKLRIEEVDVIRRAITDGMPVILPSNYDGIAFSNTDIDGECLGTVHCKLNTIHIDPSMQVKLDDDKLGASKKLTRDDYIDIAGVIKLYPHIHAIIVDCIANYMKELAIDYYMISYLINDIWSVVE